MLFFAEARKKKKKEKKSSPESITLQRSKTFLNLFFKGGRSKENGEGSKESSTPDSKRRARSPSPGDSEKGK